MSKKSSRDSAGGAVALWDRVGSQKGVAEQHPLPSFGSILRESRSTGSGGSPEPKLASGGNGFRCH